MKVKQRPEDFQVEELTDLVPAGTGPFAFYRLEKCGWSTPDALAAVRRRWRIDLGRLSYGGLKDRHAQTVQYLTIYRGPARNLTHQAVLVKYLGQLGQAYTSKDIRANRFQVTLRAVPAAQLPAMEQALGEVGREGVPNYFDDQRFGSVVSGGRFVAQELVLGRFEDALRLALTAPYEHDRGPQKKEKAILRSCWGDWPACKERLPRGHARSLATYLADHPNDYRGAVARLRPELRGLYLSAYQSHLWNRMLARWLRARCRPEQLLSVRLRLGDVPMHRQLELAQQETLAALSLPLPSARLHLDAADPRAELVNAVLAEEGLELRQFQVKGVRAMFFSKGDRSALCLPTDLHWRAAADERNAGKQKVVLTFDLPRGSYATLLLKRIGEPESRDREGAR